MPKEKVNVYACGRSKEQAIDNFYKQLNQQYLYSMKRDSGISLSDYYDSVLMNTVNIQDTCLDKDYCQYSHIL